MGPLASPWYIGNDQQCLCMCVHHICDVLELLATSDAHNAEYHELCRAHDWRNDHFQYRVLLRLGQAAVSGPAYRARSEELREEGGEGLGVVRVSKDYRMYTEL